MQIMEPQTELPLMALKCFHCGEDCVDTTFTLEDKSFCCQGCLSVFSILNKNELNTYYCLNSFPGQTVKRDKNDHWIFLEDPIVINGFTTFKNDTLHKIELYLPQIHCSSCLYLLEHLTTLQPGIKHTQVEFNSKKLYLSFNPKEINIKKIFETLAEIGYEPLMERKSSLTEIQDPKQQLTSKGAKSEEPYVMYAGISGFCFANIMILSFPEYLGLEYTTHSRLAGYFRWFSLVLSLPVFYISIKVFFISALKSLKYGLVNIDGPIFLAVCITFIRSLVEIGTGTGSGYLDSMSGIVFFMLVGRIFQNKTNASLKFDRNIDDYFPMMAKIKQGEGLLAKPVNEIKPDDVIVLNHGELIPVDGLLSKGKVSLDNSFITGESTLIEYHPGDLVYAGGRIMYSQVEIMAVKQFSQSSFLKMWSAASLNDVTVPYMKWTDKISQYFGIIVLLLATCTFGYWCFREDTFTAWNSATAIMIVACPCTLLLSSSFIDGFLMTIFSKQGFFIKNASVFDKLAKINALMFDKTGTLSKINDAPSLVFSSWNELEKKQIISLLGQSNHPVSQAIFNNYQAGEDVKCTPFESFIEIEGQGIEGKIGSLTIKAGSKEFVHPESSFEEGYALYVSINNSLKAVFETNQVLKEGVRAMLSKLVKKYKVQIISGDSTKKLDKILAVVPKGIDVQLGLSPEKKSAIISDWHQKGGNVMMVGDGLNDAGALKMSQVGVAVADNHSGFTPASDVIIKAGAIGRLNKFLNAVQYAKTLLTVTFVYSLIYNVIGVYIAAQGQMKPIIAAILMPLSSISVIVIAYLGTAWIEKNLFLKKDE